MLTFKRSHPHPLSRAGTISLAGALLLMNFVHVPNRNGNYAVHFVSGMFLGIALALLFRALGASRRHSRAVS